MTYCLDIVVSDQAQDLKKGGILEKKNKKGSGLTTKGVQIAMTR